MASALVHPSDARSPGRFRASVAAALVAAAALVLSACSDSEDPFPKGQDVPIPDSRLSLAPMPKAAKERTEAGSEAFARYYFESVVNHAYATGDLASLVGLSDPECIVCRATVGDIATAYARGRVDGGQVTVRSVKADEATPELTNVRLDYSASRYSEIDAEGRRVFGSPPKSGIELIVQLTWDEAAEAWRVREIVNADLLAGSKPQPSESASAEPSESATPSASASATETSIGTPTASPTSTP